MIRVAYKRPSLRFSAESVLWITENLPDARRIRGSWSGRILMLSSALVAVVVLLASIVIQAIAIAVTVRFVAWLLRVGYAGRSFWRNVSVTTGVMLILLVALLAQVAAWAVAFVLCGALPDFAT